MLDREEREIWQKKEDQEQIQYLQWQQELTRFKRFVAEMPRIREEYRLSRRICSGYKGKEASDMIDALNATFILEQHPVIAQQETLEIINAQLSKSSKKLLTAWEGEQKILTQPVSLEPKQELSPITVARLFARVANRENPSVADDDSDVKISPVDLALFFGVQAEQERWTPAARRMFRNAAEDQMRKFMLVQSDRRTLSRFIWKEMHDIIVKDKTTDLDHIRFGLVGTVAQRLGIDLEEKLLEPRQKYLDNKPAIRTMLNQLRKEEKGRHSLLGCLGLKRVRSVRG